MSLKRSTGNMYSFTTHQWNPVKGKCKNDCVYCLPGDTLISMADFSVKKIKDIKVGDVVIGVKDVDKDKEKYNRLRFKRFVKTQVTALHGPRIDKTIIIKTNEGTLECTPNHKLYGSTQNKSYSDWKTARAFSPYEFLRFVGMPSKKDEPFYRGYVTGFIGSSIKGCPVSQIISMSVGEEKEVYNFETEHESYVANGFVVHNCYVKRFPIKELRLDEDELKTFHGKNNFIFVCSGTDLFNNDVPSEWILKVLEQCNKYPENRYLFQSKNPERFNEFIGQYPANTVLGTTIETNRHYPDISKAPSVGVRALAMRELTDKGFKTMITCEPILDFDVDALAFWIKQIKPEWVNIGANSDYGIKLPEPDSEKVKLLVRSLREAGITVKIKSNLRRIYSE